MTLSAALHKHGTILFLTVLATLLLWMLAAGAGAQPQAKVSEANPTPAAQPAETPNSVDSVSPPADGNLKFVVALFRHGVRAPLAKFAADADKHSGCPWPSLNAWGDKDNWGSWGDLTPHGGDAVDVLGAWYGSYYSKTWGKRFKAYLWADKDERTKLTAAKLAGGFRKSDVNVTVESLDSKWADPLFHPFEAECGTPSQEELKRIVKEITTDVPTWLARSKGQLTKLYDVLACQNTCANTTCESLRSVKEEVSHWPSPSPSPRPSSPIKWDGQFSYASSASEAFLLEYANRMDPAWGKVKIGSMGSGANLSDLLPLHEFYFDKTERDWYLARIQGANLLREILTQLNRKAGQQSPLDGTCPRGNADNQFVGLVGHDTNLAHLNQLLDVKWTFNNPELPDDTRNLPDNDALPAGALLFELREGSPDYRVRIQYVAQSLSEMRNAPQPSDAYRIQTTCGKDNLPCEMSLVEFNKLAQTVIANYGHFLSHCEGGEETCH